MASYSTPIPVQVVIGRQHRGRDHTTSKIRTHNRRYYKRNMTEPTQGEIRWAHLREWPWERAGCPPSFDLQSEKSVQRERSICYGKEIHPDHLSGSRRMLSCRLENSSEGCLSKLKGGAWKEKSSFRTSKTLKFQSVRSPENVSWRTYLISHEPSSLGLLQRDQQWRCISISTWGTRRQPKDIDK